MNGGMNPPTTTGTKMNCLDRDLDIILTDINRDLDIWATMSGETISTDLECGNWNGVSFALSTNGVAFAWGMVDADEAEIMVELIEETFEGDVTVSF